MPKKMFGEGVAWDQSLHAMDYLAYAYLQLGEDGKARAVVDEIMAFKKVTPDTLPAAYAMAAIPARYAVERRNWAEAAKLELPPAKRRLGQVSVDRGNGHLRARARRRAHRRPAGARAEIDKLAATRDALLKAENKYWSDQVEAQRSAAAAILGASRGPARRGGARAPRRRRSRRLRWSKHPVTPGSIVPLHELLGDLLLEIGQPDAALAEYKRSLAGAPNRYR